MKCKIMGHLIGAYIDREEPGFIYGYDLPLSLLDSSWAHFFHYCPICGEKLEDKEDPTKTYV